jgi:hypothetical protein
MHTRYIALGATFLFAYCAAAMAQSPVPATKKPGARPAGSAIVLQGKGRAIAEVSYDGTVLGSKNIVGVTRVDVGSWCVQVNPKLDVTNAVALATPNPAYSPNILIVVYYYASDACVTGAGIPNSVEILTGTMDSGTFRYADEGFIAVIP